MAQFKFLRHLHCNTTMSKKTVHQCLFCTTSAQSREHVFPAAFGGRRFDRGIYCEEDNNKLGRHVGALLESMDYINGRLGIRRDREKVAAPRVVKDKYGNRLAIFNENIGVAPPLPLNQTPELIGQPVSLQFRNRREADQWLAQQRKAGYTFASVKYGEDQTVFATQQIELQLHFGGDKFLRAVAYLALTYLAHYFPDLARHEGMKYARDIVEKDAPLNDLVWWEPIPVLEQVPRHSFELAHSVVIATCAETGKITALISFYGALAFGVYLGSIPVEKSTRVTTHIDPLGELPNDIQITEEVGKLLGLGTPEQGQEHLVSIVRGNKTNPIVELLDRIHTKLLEKECKEMLLALMQTKSLDKREQGAAVEAIVSEKDQRILNALRVAINSFCDSSDDLPTQFKQFMQNLIAEDPSAPMGVSQTTQALVTVGRAILSEEILKAIRVGNLDVRTLMELLAGYKGVGILFEKIIRDFILKPFYKEA